MFGSKRGRTPFSRESDEKGVRPLFGPYFVPLVPLVAFVTFALAV
jgi:hypothetical protein